MPFIIRHAGDADLPAINRLASQVFRSSAEANPSMAELYPTLFAPQNAPNWTVAEADGRILSAVGMVPQPVRIGSARIVTAGIGSVCTAPEARGQGAAGRCLEAAMARALAIGAQLMWISGDRSLYRRAGCRPAGAFVERRSERDPSAWPAAPDLSIEADSDDIATIARLSALESVAFCRTPERWRRQLAGHRAGTREPVYRLRAVAVVRRGGERVAWVAYSIHERPGQPVRLEVVEVAGERTAAAAAVGQLARAHACRVVRWVTPLHECGWGERLDAVLGGEWRTEPRTNPGHTFRVLDAGELRSALAAYLDESGLAWPSSQDEAALTEALFAPGAAGRALIPLPASGLSYV
ncbi:MAG TPA: GNAT family N-acetyltransferase [Limnochordia bacterium]|nr:GNAT family N-acetyltransferase [Limnochordia bacterium]